ncbi:MAG: hypothetical protein ACLFQQ_16130 [Desulfococcaceae bacterium]
MQRDWKFRWAAVLLSALVLGLVAGCGDSDDDSADGRVDIQNNELRILSANGAVTTHVYGRGDTPLSDPLPDGGTKACFCQRLAFRAAQALEADETFAARYPDGLPMDDFEIAARWNTDGTEDLFVDALRWVNDRVWILSDATPHGQLTLADAVFYFIPVDGAAAWKVTALADLFPPDFFERRTAAKSGGAAEKAAFQPVKQEAMNILGTVPIYGGFSVKSVDPAEEGLTTHLAKKT